MKKKKINLSQGYHEASMWHESWYTYNTQHGATIFIRALWCSHVSEARGFLGDLGPKRGRLYNHEEHYEHPHCGRGMLPEDAISGGQL
jgi:hypothetical protein